MSRPAPTVSLFTVLSLSVLSGVAAQTAPVRVSTGVVPGNAGAFPPRLAAADGREVYAVWTDMRTGVREVVVFNRSLDGGNSWLPQAQRIDAGTSNSFDPDLAVAGNSVFAVYRNSRLGNDHIYVNRSLDRGVTWSATDTRIDHAPQFTPCSEQVIAAAGSAVYVCWLDQRSGEYDLWFNRSLDRGSTWLPEEVRLDIGQASLTYRPRIACAGSSVYAVYEDVRNNTAGIWFNRSLDQGSTWLMPDVRIDSGNPGIDPQIVVVDSAIYVTWQKGGVTNGDIWFNRSLDGGTKWGQAQRIDVGTPPGASLSRHPAIGADDTTVVIAWEDDRDFNLDIYANRSTDRGATWLATDVRVDRNPGTTFLQAAFDPKVGVDGDAVIVAYGDERPVTDMYCNVSTDSGATWRPVDVRLDANTTPSAPSFQPQVAISGSSAFVAWQDYTFGAAEVLFSLPFGYQSYGAGTPGTAGLVPALSGAGAPLHGATVSVDCTRGLGGAPAVLLVGAMRASVPLFGGLILVQPLLALPLPLSGTGAGQGFASLPLPIPNTPTLFDVWLDFQAIVPDPGAPSSVAVTNGLEMWIL